MPDPKTPPRKQPIDQNRHHRQRRASVNIDAKQVSNTDSFNDSAANGVIEIQNGCACCSLRVDGERDAVVVGWGGGKRTELDAIVVELSGLADPVAVRNNSKMAELVSLCCIVV